MNNNNQQQQVKNFFDDIALEYQQKYQSQHPFLNYFFQQRLSEATASFFFEKKSILDIGAGTAPLFYFLQNQTTEFQYFATDIAPKMLKESGLSEEKYFVGPLSNFPFPNKKYDFIFLLGVTTYFDTNTLNKHLQFISNHLSPNGTAIISFTNRNSLDFKIIQLARRFSRFLGLKKNVVGQSFKIFSYSQREISFIVKPNFQMHKVCYLNQTIWPFNRLFPKIAVRLAHLIKKHVSSPSINSLLSSDFLVFLNKK